LSRAIVFQLISTAAGRTIFGRLNELVGPDFTPEVILSTSVEDLRRVGLSGGKVTALRDLATQVINGTVRLERHGRMTDSEVERELIGVKGIGPWTAHMYLMFNLARPDVWPVGDLGVRNGWSVLHGLPDMISSKELETYGETFRGYRSAVAWYCWRALD
jgi:DNA-3-methyladenine glycosylase II